LRIEGTVQETTIELSTDGSPVYDGVTALTGSPTPNITTTFNGFTTNDNDAPFPDVLGGSWSWGGTFGGQPYYSDGAYYLWYTSSAPAGHGNGWYCTGSMPATDPPTLSDLSSGYFLAQSLVSGVEFTAGSPWSTGASGLFAGDLRPVWSSGAPVNGQPSWSFSALGTTWYCYYDHFSYMGSEFDSYCIADNLTIASATYYWYQNGASSSRYGSYIAAGSSSGDIGVVLQDYTRNRYDIDNWKSYALLIKVSAINTSLEPAFFVRQAIAQTINGTASISAVQTVGEDIKPEGYSVTVDVTNIPDVGIAALKIVGASGGLGTAVRWFAVIEANELFPQT
jgi:hypothetical protein